MSEDTSERKEFAASARKLRKMREQGQFAQSRDLSSFFVTAAGAVYVILALPLMANKLMALFDLAFRGIQNGYSDRLLEVLLLDLAQVLLLTLPMFLAVLVASLLAGGVIGGGIKFSPAALVPKFERINPQEGFKRLFGKQALLQFLMSLVKVIVFVGLLIGFIYFNLGFLTRGGNSFGSGISLLVYLLPRLVGVMMAIMLVIGLVDFLIQRGVFLENAKMTRTETKNESKEQEGDPLRRSRRKEIAREDIENPTGARQASFAVQQGPVMVAYRWVQGETPVPVLVAKTSSADGVRLLRGNLPERAPVIRDKLALQLVRPPIGSPVRQDDIHPLAQLMSRNGLY
ncbi:Flagellar biosynthesis protein FlhB [Candidatus Rhodobacter oscarellae]|uniref:Flagellar biosynthesis protein FlhB n=1 Tax=Candidatus Rhodobacter oscarellae TaxID=1675527 RepID=A0A0J9E3I5_9RHOB|nr:EscU/YscU/HrcU family type III secretion system export apparatus switch protein [Candidatus Rhodobacter lobularis]KMW56384.1 Flagellar biosynthesis protein FlhB [Candidatus Rhodobacter lobularis]